MATKKTEKNTFETAFKSFSSTKYQPTYNARYYTGTYNMKKYTPDYKAQTYKGPTYKAQTYKNGYQPKMYNDTYNPEQYQSKYMPQIENALNNVTNWKYDPLQDASYQALAAVYGARGNLAAKNSLADAASLNGGYGTSNAVSAAQQARNQYNQELASYIPQLEQAAYQRQQTGLNALMDIDNSLYGRFSDDQSRQLAAKQFGLDVFNTNEGNRQWAEQNRQNVWGMNRDDAYKAVQNAMDVWNMNDQSRQFAAQLGLDYDNLNENQRQFFSNYMLDKWQANQGERQFAYNAQADAKQNAIKNAYDYLSYLNAKSGGSGGGGGGGGRSRKRSGGGGYTGSGSGSSKSENPYSFPDAKKYGKVHKWDDDNKVISDEKIAKEIKKYTGKGR